MCGGVTEVWSTGPQKLFEDGVRLYITILRIVRRGESPWHTLTASEQKMATEAKAMLTTAADQEHAAAQSALSELYLEGKGVTQDNKKAARWNRKAEGQGHAEAQARLGVMYGFGQGALQDYNEAARWTRKQLIKRIAKRRTTLAPLTLSVKKLLKTTRRQRAGPGKRLTGAPPGPGLSRACGPLQNTGPSPALVFGPPQLGRPGPGPGCRRASSIGEARARPLLSAPPG
jgi:hypothetical protein